MSQCKERKVYVIPPNEFVRCTGRFSDYYINRHGTVIDGRNGREASKSVDGRTGYITVVVHLHGGRTTVTYLHRLLAIAFIPNLTGKKVETLDVNHINGNRQDNRLENLEWTTRKSNSIHAYRTGARDDNIWMELHPVWGTDAWRMTGGEPLFFYSLNETARFLGVGAPTLCTFLKQHQDNIVPFHGWYISYTDKRSLFEYDSGDYEDVYRQTVPNAADGQGVLESQLSF